MIRLFFDTETTGKYNFKGQMEDPSQPHLVQLGAVLHDEERNLRAALNLIVKPNGWEIPTEASNIHGITTEYANKYGVPMDTALAVFSNLVNLAGLVVAHNTAFDIPVMGVQFYRMGRENPLRGKETYCTMKSATNICKIPGPYGNKWPTLSEAHRHFTGEDFEGAHDAMADVLACSRVYYLLTQPEAIAV